MSSLKLRPFEYFEPATIQESTAILAAHAPEAQVLAGGIDLIPRLRGGSIEADYVVNIQRIPGIDRIEADGDTGLRFGAMARLHDLETSESVRVSYPALYDAVHQITSVQAKCMGTAVGNICVATPASDVAVALMAYDAQFTIAGPNGERQLPISEFYVGYRQTALQRGEMVTGVSMPAPIEGMGVSFMNLVRTHADIAKVTVAVALEMEGDTCRAARVAVGSVAPVSMRVPEAEAELTGRKIGPESFTRASAAAGEACRPITDLRSTAEYRKEMVRVLVGRTLSKAHSRARA